jgi:hypothetical protein
MFLLMIEKRKKLLRKEKRSSNNDIYVLQIGFEKLSDIMHGLFALQEN